MKGKKNNVLLIAMAAVIILAAVLFLTGVFPPGQKRAAAEPFIQAGSIVTFGHYPQTISGTDHTPIEWLVLDVQEGKALLISRYALDCQPYSSDGSDTTWQACSLRVWLNGTFLSTAFTDGEQKGILTTNVDNSRRQGDSGYRTEGGSDTEDKVFLLSYAEAWTYFKDDRARMCVPTEYAVGQRAYTNSNYKVNGKAACWWWLRSPGYYQCDAILVHYDGSRSYSGVYDSRDAVRPALWVDLGSGIF